MQNKKRIFSETERNFFRSILKKYSNIVECKNTDGRSLKQKNIAWNKIAYEYNASPLVSYQVTSKQLRRLWMNLKQRQRDRGTLDRALRQHQVTEGGPSSDRDTINPVVSITEGTLDNEGDTDERDDTAMDLIISDQKNFPHLYEDESETSNASTNFTQPTSHMITQLCHNTSTPEMQYSDRQAKLELHMLEKELMRERIREARAKADLAELILERHKSSL